MPGMHINHHFIHHLYDFNSHICKSNHNSLMTFRCLKMHLQIEMPADLHMYNTGCTPLWWIISNIYANLTDNGSERIFLTEQWQNVFFVKID